MNRNVYYKTRKCEIPSNNFMDRSNHKEEGGFPDTDKIYNVQLPWDRLQIKFIVQGIVIKRSYSVKIMISFPCPIWKHFLLLTFSCSNIFLF